MLAKRSGPSVVAEKLRLSWDEVSEMKASDEAEEWKGEEKWESEVCNLQHRSLGV